MSDEKIDLMVNSILNVLEDMEESEILSTIVMILEYYTTRFDKNISPTLTLIKKGYNKYLEFLKEGEK